MAKILNNLSSILVIITFAIVDITSGFWKTEFFFIVHLREY